MSCGIYKIRNLVNGKCYTGSSVNFDQRWKGHRASLTKNKDHHSIKLQRAWDKYGEENFIFEVIEYCEEGIPEEDLLAREQHWMDALDCVKNGYNMCPIAGKPPTQWGHTWATWAKGTPRGPMSEEQKAKVSASKKGVPLDMTEEEIQLRNKATWITRYANGTDKHSDATKEKISLAKMGQPSAMKGRQHSAETRAKMSEAHMGKVLTPEHRKNMSLGQMGHEVSDETKAKIGAANKGNPSWCKGLKLGPHSEETKAKQSAAKKGKPLSWYTPEKMQDALQKTWETRRENGTDKQSDETKAKISASKKGVPNFKKRRYIEFRGERLSVHDWSERTGWTPGMITGRIKVGWPLHVVLGTKDVVKAYKSALFRDAKRKQLAMKKELLTDDAIHLLTWIEADSEERKTLVPNDVKVTSKERLALTIDYPLHTPAHVGLEQEGGFTLSRLLDGIGEAYLAVYKTEEESMTTDTDYRPTLINRPASNGKYGIWGHDLSDLFVESLQVVDSEVKIGMGS